MIRCMREISYRMAMTSAVLVAVLASVSTPVYAKSPVKLQNFSGAIDLLEPDVLLPFTFEGTASHLGQFEASGEIVFIPGEEEGSLLGDGVAVFVAANGDKLVGVVTWDADPPDDPANADARNSHVHFSWRDSIELADGTLVYSSGRFVQDRPPGIIASFYMCDTGRCCSGSGDDKICRCCW